MAVPTPIKEMSREGEEKPHILWTHYDVDYHVIRGIITSTNRRTAKNISQKIKNQCCKIRRALQHNREDMWETNKETITKDEFIHQIRQMDGVYVSSALDVHHTDFVRSVIFYSFKRFYLTSFVDRELLTGLHPGAIVSKRVSTPEGDPLGRHTYFILFDTVQTYIQVMTLYFNNYYDYMPHDIYRRVSPDMRAATSAKIIYSQLPPNNAHFQERVLSWDIECSSHSSNIPSGFVKDDRLQLLVCTIFDDGVIVRSYALLLQFINVINVLETERALSDRVGHPVSLQTFASENGIVVEFLKILDREQPTVMVGYNTSGFDTPFILDKLALLRQKQLLNKIMTARFSAQFFSDTNRREIYTKYCVPIDMFLIMKKNDQDAFKYVNIDEHSNNSLDYFATKYLGQCKDKMDEHITITTRKVANMLGYGPEETPTPLNLPLLHDFISYCIMDTLLPARLMFKFGTVATLRHQAHIMQCPTTNMFTMGITQQMPYLIYNRMAPHIIPCFELMCCSPSDVGVKMSMIAFYYQGHPLNKRSYEGAIVVREPGRHESVVCMDFESLYPSCQIYANNSIETRIRRPAQLRVYPTRPIVFDRINDERATIWFRTDIDGQIPQIMRMLLESRRQIKRELKQTTDPGTKTILDIKQLAYKLVANSSYGAGAAGNTIMRCEEVSEVTTAVARQQFFNINYAIDHLVYKRAWKSDGSSSDDDGEEGDSEDDILSLALPGRQLKIVYGDTDSIMIANLRRDKIDLLSRCIRDGIQSAFPGGVINLEYEYYTTCMFVLSAKRYCIVDPNDVDKEPNQQKIKSKGLKSARGDTLRIIRELDVEIQHQLLKCTSEDLLNIAVRLCSRYIALLFETPLRSFVINQKVKSIESYKNTNLPQVAAWYNKQSRGYHHVSGDKISYILVHNNEDGQIPNYRRARFVDINDKRLDQSVRSLQDEPDLDLYVVHYINQLVQLGCDWLVGSDNDYQLRRSFFQLMKEKCRELYGVTIKTPSRLKPRLTKSTFPPPSQIPHHIYNPQLRIVIRSNNNS